MKKKNLVLWSFLVSLLLINFEGQCQFDSAFYMQKVERWDSNGFIKFYPNEILTGELFTIYQENFLQDPNKEMILERSGYDELLDLWYYNYKQYYLHIPVEGTYLTELEIDGYVHYASMKFCPGIYGTTNPEAVLPERNAFDNLLTNFPERVFAWTDTSWENSLKLDLGNDSATYMPTGELIWAIDDFDSLDLVIDSNRYTLCYVYHLYMIDPYEYIICYINAYDGSLFKIRNTEYYNGPATLLNTDYGDRTIDTKKSWGKWHLVTDNSGRNIETRYYAQKWGNGTKPTDTDDDWGISFQQATSAHYYASMSWNYFKDKHLRDGLNDNGKELRVMVDYTTMSKFRHEPHKFLLFHYYRDYIFIGKYDATGNKQNCVDVMGHEFTHGVNEYTAKLGNSGETGAILESMCDIFGFMVERYTQYDDDNSLDWTLGEDSDNGQVRRYMNDPTLHSDATYDGNTTGHPSYYNENHRWYPANTDDYEFSHRNCGVMNKWFYLASQPTTKIFRNVTVTGIGYDNVASLVYSILANGYISNGSDYEDMECATRDIAELKWTKCSNNYIQVIESWKAVNVGKGAQCQPQSISKINVYNNNIVVYNREINTFNVISDKPVSRMEVYDLSGKIIASNKNSNSIYLKNISNGVYIVLTQSGDEICYNKIIVVQ